MLSCDEIPTPDEQTSGVQRSPPPRDRPAEKKSPYGLVYILGLSGSGYQNYASSPDCDNILKGGKL